MSFVLQRKPFAQRWCNGEGIFGAALLAAFEKCCPISNNTNTLCSAANCSGDKINALALLHDAPSDATILAAAPDGCVVALLERHELQACLGDAETILNR